MTTPSTPLIGTSCLIHVRTCVQNVSCKLYHIALACLLDTPAPATTCCGIPPETCDRYCYPCVSLCITPLLAGAMIQCFSGNLIAAGVSAGGCSGCGCCLYRMDLYYSRQETLAQTPGPLVDSLHEHSAPRSLSGMGRTGDEDSQGIKRDEG